MKLFILAIFVTLLMQGKLFACQVNIPTSEVQRYIDAFEKTGQGVPPLYSCADKPEETCECVDDVTDWDAMINIDEVDDLGIYTGKMLLRPSPVKKAAKEAKLEADKLAEVEKREKKRLAKDKVKDFKFKGKTIAELRDEMNAFANEMKEAGE